MPMHTPMWQYFVTVQGVTTLYPPTANVCTGTDVVRRLSFLSGQNVDLVIALDGSNPMSELVGSFSMWDIGGWLTHVLLEETTSFGDRVAMVGVSSHMEQAEDVVLKSVNKYIINVIANHIKAWKPNGETSYLPLLEQAIHIFRRSPSKVTSAGIPCVFPFTYQNVVYNDCTTVDYNASWCATTSNFVNDGEWSVCSLTRRTKVLVFVSGSESENETIADIKEFVHNRSNSVLNDIKIIAFGLGRYMNFLQVCFSPGGKHISIERLQNPYDTSLVTFPYALFLAVHGAREPVFSMPYKNILYHGIVVTLSQAVFDNDTFVGIVGIDMKVADLLREIIYDGSGSNSYFFVMNRENGYCLFHPMAPPYVDHRHPTVLRTTFLEPEAARHNLLNDMASVDSGDAYIVVRRTISNGDPSRDGSKTTTTNATFTFESIEGTNFSLCLVVYEGAKEVRYSNLSRVPEVRLLYYAYAGESGMKQCELFTKIVTLNSSVVKFEPTSFIDPFLFAENKTFPSKTQVKEYIDVLQGKSTKRIFRENVKDGVIITSLLDNIWRYHNNGSYPFWRSIILDTGVLRVYPGIRMARRISHTTSSFYRKAIAEQGRIVVSGPYLDDGGAGYLLTIHKAIYVPGSSTEVFAVQTVDIPLEHAYNEMLGDYTPCKGKKTRYGNSCILLNKAGYVILHKRFMAAPKTWSEMPRLTNRHITSMERHIAHDMLKWGFMNKTSWFDLANNKEYMSYVLSEERKTSTTNTRFTFTHISGTNTFLVVIRSKRYRYKDSSKCVCVDWVSSKLPYCKANGSNVCECPCYKTVEFIHQNGTFIKDDLVLSVPPPITSNHPEQSHREQARRGRERFKPCFNFSCNEQFTERKCHHQLGCRWCSAGWDGRPLGSNSYCADRQECYFGMVGHPGPYGDYVKVEDSSHVKILLYLFATFALIIVTAVVSFNCRHRLECICREDENFKDIFT
ncbi:hypothetical protein NP493_535g00017 [Ridgeia piscesae]|uniref:Fibronectin type-II domain-containing protein n=1 Tax=Ridgeia piscesae TaxID=27915 RepID=A0AAD9KWA5_RIDPI|nr:hypothetical protein NP493_535g00017 [Ridgeia piscesae]